MGKILFRSNRLLVAVPLVTTRALPFCQSCIQFLNTSTLCPQSNNFLKRFCQDQSGPMMNGTQVKWGGGGGGGATYVFKVR